MIALANRANLIRAFNYHIRLLLLLFKVSVLFLLNDVLLILNLVLNDLEKHVEAWPDLFVDLIMLVQLMLIG